MSSVLGSLGQGSGGDKAIGLHRGKWREPYKGENSTYQLRRKLQIFFHVPATSFFLSLAKSIIPQTFCSLHKPICKENPGTKYKICNMTILAKGKKMLGSHCPGPCRIAHSPVPLQGADLPRTVRR